MTTLFRILLFALLGSVASADKLKIVATIPDLADIAQELGGNRVEVKAIAKGTQNVHAVPLRPSTLVAVNKADMFLQIGMSLEHAYVPGLLMRARNETVEPGGKGFVDTSIGWEAIQVLTDLSRRQGTDLHPQGNPHINLDPKGGPFIAKHILAGLVRVDPQGKAYYEKNYEAYLAKVEEASVRWDAVHEKVKGKKVVTYHADFNYLLKALDITLLSTVEPGFGVPPTPKDLARLVKRMKDEKVKVIMTAKWSNNQNVRFLAEKTGATVIEAPAMVGGVPGADTWIQMMDILHRDLAKALE